MSQAISLANVDATNGDAEHIEEQQSPDLTTLPPPDANFQISLTEKVIAITGANRGEDSIEIRMPSHSTFTLTLRRYWSWYS